MTEFKNSISKGIPSILPSVKKRRPDISHAPNRKVLLSKEEKVLALKNALRYFPENQHDALAKEFLEELNSFGRIYMYRFQPDYKMYARPIDEYPGKSNEIKSIMLMIQNNLDASVAENPDNLVVYGGKGKAARNWNSYDSILKCLKRMDIDETLLIQSGKPIGIAKTQPHAPRVLIANSNLVPADVRVAFPFPRGGRTRQPPFLANGPV